MPASGNPELSAGWVTDPVGTLNKCLRAIRRSKGVIKDAAKELGVDRRTLWRYIGEHKELADELESMREAHHGRKPIWEGTRDGSHTTKPRKKKRAARTNGAST